MARFQRADSPSENAESPGEHVEIPPERLEEFEAAARRPLPQRLRYAFIKTYKPVLDDAEYRSLERQAG